jgi:hypothetical protein
LSKYRNKLAELSNSRTVDAISVLQLGRTIATVIDVKDEFVKLATASEPGGNPEIWCVKAAATISYEGGRADIVLKFIKALPKLLQSQSG